MRFYLLRAERLDLTHLEYAGSPLAARPCRSRPRRCRPGGNQHMGLRCVRRSTRPRTRPTFCDPEVGRASVDSCPADFGHAQVEAPCTIPRADSGDRFTVARGPLQSVSLRVFLPERHHHAFSTRTPTSRPRTPGLAADIAVTLGGETLVLGARPRHPRAQIRRSAFMMPTSAALSGAPADQKCSILCTFSAEEPSNGKAGGSIVTHATLNADCSVAHGDYREAIRVGRPGRVPRRATLRDDWVRKRR